MTRDQSSPIRRIGRYWRIRFPGSHFLLFKHQAEAEHAANLDLAGAAENSGCVGISKGRLVRTRHLVDRGGRQRVFFVIGGEDVDASDSQDIDRLVFVDPGGQRYPVGYPRCADCGEGLQAKDARGRWIEVNELACGLVLTGAGRVDFADGLRWCAMCGSRFTDTRFGWGWRPVKAYGARCRPSVWDTLNQVAAVSAILGPLALISLWPADLSGWWIILVAAIWFVAFGAAAGFLDILYHERNIPESALDAARRAAEAWDRDARQRDGLPLFDALR